MFTKKFITTLSTLGLVASVSWAQDSTTESSAMTLPTAGARNVYDPVGWFPFLGVSGGYMSDANNQNLTEGSPTEFRLMGSRFNETRRSVLDLGIGFMGNSFEDKSVTRNNFISGGVAEVAWRYNTANRWQFGPIADAYYTGANNRFASTDPNWTSFAGVQILKEFPIRDASMFRVGLKGLTDLSVKNADINTVMLDLQWGFGSEKKTTPVSAVEPAAAPAIADTATSGTGAVYGTTSNSARVIETDAANGTMTIRDENRMQFDSGASTLDQENQGFVHTVGAAIAERPDLFDRVEVVGFADQTGSDETNMRVSKQRAQSVATLLRESGVDGAKITSSWKGASEPLYQSLLPEDLQQNRRVDILFHGVKDQAALADLLNSIL
ncbi:MAG: OmpA family protein [Bdellovibrionaceae bacterium]|nr:OmpA family protein [Pseudobdellovibrionaceae bacterium]